MPISLSCDCGRAMRIKDELAGRKIRCPACATVLKVPEPEKPKKDAEDEALYLLMEAPDNATSSRSRYDTDEAPAATEAIQPDRPGPKPTAKSEPERPEWKWKKKKGLKSIRKQSDGSHRGLFDRLQINVGVVGMGLLMMFVAFVWFVVGLWAGWLFYYPPVLFLIGIGTVFKGLMGWGRD